MVWVDFKRNPAIRYYTVLVSFRKWYRNFRNATARVQIKHIEFKSCVILKDFFESPYAGGTN